MGIVGEALTAMTFQGLFMTLTKILLAGGVDDVKVGMAVMRTKGKARDYVGY